MITIRGLFVAFVHLTLLVFFISLYFVTLRFGIDYPVTTDFAKFYASAEFLRSGEDIYSPIPVESLGPLPPDSKFTRETLHPNLNLPIVTALFVPFTFLDYGYAFVLWSIFSLLFGLAAILLLASRVQKSSALKVGPIWLAILLVSYYPTWANIKLGQVALLLFFLVTIGLISAQDGKKRVAGIVFGLALLLKVFTLALIPYLLVCRQWRIAAWSLGVFSAGILSSIAVMGFDAHVNYIEMIQSITWYGSNWNASLSSFFTRIFGGSENVPALSFPWIAWALSYGISVALIMHLLFVAVRHGCSDSCQRFNLGFGLILSIMLLAAPLGWMYYFPLLFIAFFSAARIVDSTSGLGTKLIIYMAFILSAIPKPLVPSGELEEPVAWFTWASVYFYALVLLNVALFRLYRK